MIYINKTAKDIYVELDSALDPESNLIGTTWDDFSNGYWVLLSDEQIAFRDANPKASIGEVFRMQIEVEEAPIIDEEELALTDAMKAKLIDIEAQDKESNLFYINVVKDGETIAHQPLWIDKDLRNSLYSITLPALKAKGETMTKLWTTDQPPVSVEVPIDWAMEKLPELEVYAKETYDLRAANEAAVYAAYNNKDIESIQAINVKAGYPMYKQFKFEL